MNVNENGILHSKGIDFYRQQSIEWLKDEKALYESNPPSNAVNVDITIMKLNMVLKQKENELNKADRYFKNVLAEFARAGFEIRANLLAPARRGAPKF